jgi:hypothetical protein
MNDEKSIATKGLLDDLLPTMEGWLTTERAHEMYDLVRQMNPSYIVEIGVFGGRSLIAQAMALRDCGGGKIIGIDPWKKDTAVVAQTDAAQADWWANLDYYKIHQGCMDVIWKLNLDSFVNIIRSGSENCHQLVPACDILYIDGGHSEEFSCRDVQWYLPKVKQNGYIWFDDADWLSTQKAIGMLKEQCVLVKDCGNYLLFCKK